MAASAAQPASATRATLAFMRRAWAALAFGFLLAFSSSVGQSYFIGLFGPSVRADLGLSHGQFGGVYSIATLASAGALLFAGKLVDRVCARDAALITCAWLAGATALMAFAANALMLAAALFALRLGGQGMMSHIALTTLGRWFDRERGRAVAIATLGFPSAEAILPPIVAIALVQTSYEAVWLFAAAAMLVVVAPAVVGLSSIATRERDAHARSRAGETQSGAARISWRRAQVLRDARFYALCPGLLAAPFIVTGLLFHQGRLVEINDWPLTAFAALFPLFAGAAVGSGLLIGALTDRFGSRRILPVFIAPLGAALVLFALTGSLAVAGLAMALTGMTAGGATVLFGTVWVELYGPAYLGEIRALATSLMVLATALAPGAMGALIDAGVGLDAQFFALAVYIAGCIAILIRLQPSLVATPPPDAAQGSA